MWPDEYFRPRRSRRRMQITDWVLVLVIGIVLGLAILFAFWVR
jgi:hypothetical protein